MYMIVPMVMSYRLRYLVMGGYINNLFSRTKVNSLHTHTLATYYYVTINNSEHMFGT